MSRVSWSEEELEFLQSIARSDEISALAKKYANYAKKQGWQHRSETAIRVKLKRLQISFIPIDDGWNCTGLADVLGIDRDRVHDWVERGLLSSKRKAGKRHHRIKQSDFVEFAKAHPEWLSGIDRERLEYLLPAKLVHSIVFQKPRTRGVRMAVRTNSGKLYPSLRAASRGEFYAKKHIKELAETGKKTKNGVGFAFVHHAQ